MPWLPQGLSVIGALAAVVSFGVFTALLAWQFIHTGDIPWQILALWGFTFWALTGIKPSELFDAWDHKGDKK